MPTIPLATGLGIEVNGSLAPGASLRSLVANFHEFTPLTLAALPRSFLQAGFQVTRDVPLSSGFGFNITAGSSATLTVIRDAGRAIDEADPFPAVIFKDNETCLAFTFQASFEPGITLDSGPASFGFTKGVSHQWTIYRRFPSTEQFGASFTRMLDEFVIPATRAELAALSPDIVLVCYGAGSLTTSAELSLSMTVAPLANLSLPRGRRLSVKPELSMSVAPSFTFKGSYQVRIRKLDTGEVEFGLYQGESATHSLSLSVRASLPARPGSFDLTGQLIRGLSTGNPIVNRDEMFAALPGEDSEFEKQRRVEKLEEQLRSAVNTRFEASAKVALSRMKANQPLWTYAIDPAAASANTDEAVASALKGNFDRLLANPPGVRRLSSALAETLSNSTRFDLNLLGLANFTSAAELVLSSEIQYNHQNQITLITDTASVSRFTALLLNFGRNTRRLQHLCTESFLVRAAYQASGLAILPPRTTSRHTYFELHASTSWEEMRNNLQALRALGLLAEDEATQILALPGPFGRTTLYLEAAYDEAGVAALLFDNGQPRSLEKFQEAGRSALHALIDGDDNRALTRRFTSLTAGGQATWNALTAKGPNAVAEVLGIRLLDIKQRLALETARTDFLAITYWAKAAHKAAVAALETRQLLEGETVSSTDPRFHKARRHLQKSLSKLAEYTGHHFGDPLGLLMMHVAAGHTGKLGAILTSDVTGRRLFGALQESAAGV
jgi:hypothetical protein